MPSTSYLYHSPYHILDPSIPSISAHPTVPYQSPFSSLPTNLHSRSNSHQNSHSTHHCPLTRTSSNISTASLHKPLPAAPTSDPEAKPIPRELDFSSPVTGASIHSHPFSSSYIPSSSTEKGRFAHAGVALPYAPFASDYNTRPRTSSFGRRKAGETSSTHVERRDKEIENEGSRSDLGLGASSRIRADSLPNPSQSPPNTTQPLTLNTSSTSLSNPSTQPTLLPRNDPSTSSSFYPDATSADGLARSYTQTIFKRPESRGSSVSSKRFSNQLFSR